MKLKMFPMRPLMLTLFVFLYSAITLQAQTTAFTYQGRFTDTNVAPSGTYQMQFTLFDGAGNQIGATIENTGVSVANGIFTVQLDFGATAFTGGNRSLQIAIKRPADASYTTLNPRQPITSVPSAVRSISAATADTAITATTANTAITATTANTATNAAQLGGIAANQYVLTTDPRLTSGGGSGSYINNTTTQQTANFNITGNGTSGGTLSANVVNAQTQYNFKGNRILSSPNYLQGGPGGFIPNLFIGIDAGRDTTLQGSANTFVGSQAGAFNTTGNSNSMFGWEAGSGTFQGNNNSFFGAEAGGVTSGSGNSFFGKDVGHFNRGGNNNSFFGILVLCNLIY